MSGGSTAESSFRTGREIAEEQRNGARPGPERSGDLDILPTSSVVIRPEVTEPQARSLWNAILTLRGVILEDSECFDAIAGKREMNRTGATRLAVAFGLSIEERGIDEGRVEDVSTGEFDYRYRVRIRVSKGSRYVDGIGSCRISEISTDTKRGDRFSTSEAEHFALTRAWTRAAKRAIADILGGTEADQVDNRRGAA